ncbi:MAG: pyridoxamine 5'-phosphate oxidase family protein [Oscillospiraceae bacterium]
MKRILDFLKANPTFYFATVDGYRPRVRPFGFYMQYNDKLYFGMGKHKKCYKQLLANPNIEVCTASEDGQWIRIRGVAQFDNSADALEQAFNTMPSLHDIYNAESGFTFGLVYIDHAEAELADMDGNFEKLEI